MSRFTGGWIKLYRQTAEEDIGSNGFKLALWVTLLMWATRFETTIDWKGRPRKVPPGSVLFGMQEIADKLQFSKKTVHKHLHYLQERESIVLEVQTRGCLVTICNWKEYQEVEDGVVTPREHGGNAEGTRREHGATLNGEEKKRRKKEGAGIHLEYPPIFESLWEKYGRVGSKKSAYVTFQKPPLSEQQIIELTEAIKNYYQKKEEWKSPQHFSTFLASDWRQYLETPANGHAKAPPDEGKPFDMNNYYDSMYRNLKD